MANVTAILPGVTLADMNLMTVVELSEWHDRALARAPSQE